MCVYVFLHSFVCFIVFHVIFPATTVKPVLGGHSNIDKTKVLMANDSLMKVQRGAFCNAFDLH